jgi:hypothetical protein
MNDFKLRVWCRRNKYFTYNPFYSCAGGQLIWLHTENNVTVTNLDGGIEYVAQLGSGIFDRNGKEVFEGDVVIVRFKTDEHGDKEAYISKVTYEDGAFGDNYDYFCNYRMLPEFSLEVVGHIFDGREHNL